MFESLGIIGAVLVVVFIFWLWGNASQNEKDKDEYERVTGRSVPNYIIPEAYWEEPQDFSDWKAAGKPKRWPE